MDKLTLISGTLFVAADVFAIVSLIMPDWIVSDFGGDTRLGLMWSCMTLHNRPQVCFTPDLQPEWLLALICIFVGCICITTTIILLIASHFDRNVIPYARWVGFSAMVVFCLAAVIFPMGFHVVEIGGQPYQLPNSHQVGISYILFVLSLWITVISELFAGFKYNVFVFNIIFAFYLPSFELYRFPTLIPINVDLVGLNYMHEMRGALALIIGPKCGGDKASYSLGDICPTTLPRNMVYKALYSLGDIVPRHVAGGHLRIMLRVTSFNK